MLNGANDIVTHNVTIYHHTAYIVGRQWRMCS